MKIKNKYTGFTLEPSTKIDRIDPSQITAKEFFDSYISKRKPCILTKINLDSTNNILKWKDLDYISNHAGHLICTVESKQDAQFGSSKQRTQTTCHQFINSLKSGESNEYLTTQYTDTTKTPLDDYCAAPLIALTNDFPARPCLIDTLVPQQVNIWLGASLDGTSSGLHHDFADNLYVLLKGTKRFTITSPRDALTMHTFGKIRGVFGNGLVQYSKFVRSDGAYIGDVLKYKLDLAEQELTRLEKEEEEDTEAIQYAADRVEELMEKMLDFEMDDRHDMMVDACSFSKASAQEFHLKSGVYKDLEKVVRCKVELKAGEMFYLPASWFHEVTSFSGDDRVHMAMNYWFHPPTTNNYMAPYEDGFWANKWKETELLLGALNSSEMCVDDTNAADQLRVLKEMNNKRKDRDLDEKYGKEVDFRCSGRWRIKQK